MGINEIEIYLNFLIYLLLFFFDLFCAGVVAAYHHSFESVRECCKHLTSPLQCYSIWLYLWYAKSQQEYLIN